jgi:hypothetical protein
MARADTNVERLCKDVGLADIATTFGNGTLSQFFETEIDHCPDPARWIMRPVPAVIGAMTRG